MHPAHRAERAIEARTNLSAEFLESRRKKGAQGDKRRGAKATAAHDPRTANRTRLLTRAAIPSFPYDFFAAR